MFKAIVHPAHYSNPIEMPFKCSLAQFLQATKDLVEAGGYKHLNPIRICKDELMICKIVMEAGVVVVKA